MNKKTIIIIAVILLFLWLRNKKTTAATAPAPIRTGGVKSPIDNTGEIADLNNPIDLIAPTKGDNLLDEIKGTQTQIIPNGGGLLDTGIKTNTEPDFEPLPTSYTNPKINAPVKLENTYTNILTDLV